MSKHPKEPAFWVPPQFDTDGVQSYSAIGVDGKEYPDPVSSSVGLDAPVLPQHDILQTIRDLMTSEELRRRADEEGWDTPEEADDFADWEDEFELTPYQKQLMEQDLNPAPVAKATHGVQNLSINEPETGGSVKAEKLPDPPSSSKDIGPGTAGGSQIIPPSRPSE